MTVELRRATSDDGPRAADTLIRARRAAFPAVPASVHPDAAVRAWFTDVVMPNHEVWLATDGVAVVGVMALSEDWIDQLYIDFPWTGQG
ncbi:MAG TPA: hypothetical protein VM030_04640, partial [Acidimicrobiales bacterium]|nr:hypothetical protein [Acidimicrobiales bacterium]